jgi:hypothetical protein
MAKHNPKKIVVIWRGILFGGFMDGSFVKVTPQEDAATKHVGADGKATVCLNPNKGADVSVTLTQSSPTNDILSSLVPDADSNSLPSGEFVMKDLNGTTICHAEIAWLKRAPETGFGQEVEGREWMLDCEAMTIHVGGNFL